MGKHLIAEELVSSKKTLRRRKLLTDKAQVPVFLNAKFQTGLNK